MNERIRLMTHNVWNCDHNCPQWADRGEDCSAEARVGGLLRVYRETLPDIVGGQEVSARMVDLLKAGFQREAVQYTVIWGRFTPILYRADKLDLIDAAFGTYPEHIPGMEGSFNDIQTKSWNLGVFRVKSTGKIFVFATTHLWWKAEPTEESHFGKANYQIGSDDARLWQISLLSEKIGLYREKYSCPAILVGDMNSGYRSKAMTHLFLQGFRHAHDLATEYAEEAMGYHYCCPSGYQTTYYDRPFERAIDHICVLGERAGAVKRFERYSPDYYYPISDHSPAYIDIEI